MNDDLRTRLAIPAIQLDAINALLLDPDTRVVNDLLRVVEKYGTPSEINAQARAARELSNLTRQLAAMDSPYLADLEWLTGQRETGAFVSLDEYAHAVVGTRRDPTTFDPSFAVTLEISSLHYFPWLIAEAKHSIQHRELMPGRYIRVRKMKEAENDNGDLLAVAAAMQIIGASYVETLDTRGTDGSNVHLGGPETIAGYFGGVGQPNDHALLWADEFLHYYTQYGITQVLNVNAGTILVAYLLYKLGIDIEFKISVFMGNDNPYAVLWTLLGATLFARPDGSSPLIGFNFSNSVNNETIELCTELRRALDFETVVRFEHHITETWKHIVRQPYLRRTALLDLAARVPNISAKHEGGDPDVEVTRAYPSDVLDYFRAKAEMEANHLMASLEQSYMDKHESVQRTARALTERGIAVLPAKHLHRTSREKYELRQVDVGIG
ncbi:MAG TPA: hypothetical protein VFD70_21710 [Anaerolineae bacterium]|nr:hypothetical protein [Anaerolineae bacterium]